MDIVSGNVRIQFQIWGLQARMALSSMFGIQSQSQCLLSNVDIKCLVSIECLA